MNVLNKLAGIGAKLGGPKTLGYVGGFLGLIANISTGIAQQNAMKETIKEEAMKAAKIAVEEALKNK